MIRFSRPCYDKLHRCPGWAGGGIRCAKVSRCDGGSLAGIPGCYYKKNGELRSKRAIRWRFNRCPECRVIILPSVVRWIDPGWWSWKFDGWRLDVADLKKRWREAPRDHFWQEVLRYPRWRYRIWRLVKWMFYPD